MHGEEAQKEKGGIHALENVYPSALEERMLMLGREGAFGGLRYLREYLSSLVLLTAIWYFEDFAIL